MTDFPRYTSMIGAFHVDRPVHRMQLAVVPQRPGTVLAAPRRIYLAGPMTGLPGNNYRAFHDVAGELRAGRHTVRSPAEFDPAFGHRDGADFPLRDAFAQYVRDLGWCEVVVVLPGWQHSRGVLAELAVAAVFDLAVVEAEAWQAWRNSLSET